MTYSNDGRVIGDLGRLVLLGRGRGLLNSQVLHIATSKDDVFVDLIGGCYLLFRVTLSALCTE